ncbi:uncharacterized protein SCHCODRAFT_01284597 [Schizophyllum commune H4-8]|uniref:uncharacterized protein n=1 Tax=Schizophyllum commune (strain H4-8 / FGSC 9210) TaxID=578458 RepID=UPI00215E9A87|nr:uncharacterized protein SCHCODRAFT_01284597 [Schizophyllum commune H4-8]KAI5895402.1 hypothetical protein SCHCODRAFT_01284597 [Schizophyllum commune H4-8]
MPRERTDTTLRRARQRVEGAQALEAVRHHAKRKTHKASHPQNKQPELEAKSQPLSEIEKLYSTCTVPDHIPTDLDTPEVAGDSTRGRRTPVITATARAMPSRRAP